MRSLLVEVYSVPARSAVKYVVDAGNRIELRQVGRVFWSPKSVKKGRADDQNALRITKSFRDQSRNVLYYGFCTDRDVKSFLNHVYGPVRRLDEDRNFWIHLHIARECMSQTPLRQQDWAAEPNEPRRLPT